MVQLDSAPIDDALSDREVEHAAVTSIDVIRKHGKSIYDSSGPAVPASF